MTLKPTRGLLFVVPIGKIDPPKEGMGFSAEKQKHKPEEPYKFKVTAVGGPLPFDGIWVPSEVAVGDIVSLNQSNAAMRERIAEGAGFLLDGAWYYPVDFRDVIGYWRDDEKTDPGTGGCSVFVSD